MNLLSLLNPAEDCVVGVERPDRVTLVRVQVETTVAARSLMLLCTDEKPAAASGESSLRLTEAESVRSPVLLPAHTKPVRMSPLASKMTSASTPVTWASNVVVLPGPGPAPASAHTLLRRRLASISDVLNPEDTKINAEDNYVANIPQDGPNSEYCSVTGCLRRPSPHNQGKCALHKGMKLCQVSGCYRPVQSRGCCKSHGGGARCKHPDCTKGAISKGRCRSHGGGTRCAVPECSKWAQRFGCCVRHSKSINPALGRMNY